MREAFLFSSILKMYLDPNNVTDNNIEDGTQASDSVSLHVHLDVRGLLIQLLELLVLEVIITRSNQNNNDNSD